MSHVWTATHEKTVYQDGRLRGPRYLNPDCQAFLRFNGFWREQVREWRQVRERRQEEVPPDLKSGVVA